MAYRNDLQDRILAIPAVYCPEEFRDFIVLGNPISWNETMVKDDGTPQERLRDLCIILENRTPKSKLME